MAARHVFSAPAGIEALRSEARLAVSPWEGDRAVTIPKWLMVLAARGEVTLRMVVDLEDDPLSDPDDTAPGD